MISCNLATHKKRKDLLPKVINCLHNQTVKPDVIRIHYNDYNPLGFDWAIEEVGEDLTDRAKFKWVQDDEIYFSMDDDLYYPPDYIERTLQSLRKYPEFVLTYHGRLLLGKNRDYYKGHKNYTFMSTVAEDKSIDIPGTGVTCFDTRHFKPDILQYDEDCMADVLLGLEAAKAGKQVVCLAHESNWIRAANVNDSIYNRYVNNAERQKQLCNQIIDIKGN